ncbi:MAG: Fe-S cluster assembly ATPase SufC [Magnetococcales bacterium]|nr:Fe-S cluster assembly ATPase SufC [Magnetococcales bacterium]MBF0149742.1 Fe-S cluster assembly ATPase SufC [Magnetococcales bacterium]MBF0174525.1 Fe-S cluster assembly ATPase SufC [Magnetococcales bacterium]
MLEVRDLHVSVMHKPVLRGVDLVLHGGEIHAIMGPNGSGKSTLAHVLAGRDDAQVTAGTMLYQGMDVLAMTPEIRAGAGMFLAFQNPVEIPGVSNVRLLKEASNAHRRYLQLPEMDAMTFRSQLQDRARRLGLADDWLLRAVNVGFSGGEKKRNELLQMLVLEPHLAILDEIDSGLDIDALTTVAEGINSLRDAQRAMLLITHYPRLLDLVVPDKVHVLIGGRIVLTGGPELAGQLEARGYGWLAEEHS